MSNASYFKAADSLLIRMPLLPVDQTEATLLEADPESAAYEKELTQYLVDITRHPPFREALEFSSAALAQTLAKIECGATVPRKRLERAAVSATRYLLRAATRPTPFGLMAGVSLGAFAAEPRARTGGSHEKRVIVDSAWAEKLIAQWTKNPDIQKKMSVCANNLCYARGERLVLPYVRVAGGGHSHQPHGRQTEITVRSTELVRFVMSTAQHPLSYGELLEATCQEFTTLNTHQVGSALSALLEREFLVSDVAPRQDTADPLGPARSVVSADAVSQDHLGTIDRALSDYSAKPIGDGRQAWTTLMGTLGGMVPETGPPVQVDLRSDADIVLPNVVKEELERTASMLWSLTDPAGRSEHLVEYHEAFVERYGTHQLVPLLDVLDPHRGLDAPAGYLNPPTSRHLADVNAERAPDGARALDPEREAYLSSLVQSAMLNGRKEIVLDDAALERLSHKEAVEPTVSTDLCFQLLSRSVDDLSSGDFTISLSPFSGGSRAGSMTGRFVDTLDALEPMRSIVAGCSPEAGAIRAQVYFKPAGAGALNVCTVPPLLAHTISVGEFPGSGPGSIEPADLLVGATHDRLYLVRSSDGREVLPVVPHALNMVNAAPNIARFLVDIASYSEGNFQRWGWGKKLKALPYLPRVRYGRTLVSQARWRPDLSLSRQGMPWAQWCEAFAAWREQWHVPTFVQLAVTDRRIELSLSSMWHLRLLYAELQKNPTALIFESPISDRESLGWSNGFAPEVVVSLTGIGAENPVPPSRSMDLRSATITPVHYAPGSEWLYVKFYVMAELQDNFIGRSVPDLLDSLPDCVDRWFYMRYLDPDPHIRLRFQGDPARLCGELIPALSAWASKAQDSRLIRNWSLDTYVPEVGRYGGVKGIALAEDFFHADSEACAVQHQLRGKGRLTMPIEALAASNHAAVLQSFGDWDWRSWVIRNFARGTEGHPSETRDLMPLIGDPGLHMRSDRLEGKHLSSFWEQRTRAGNAYGRFLFDRDRDHGVDAAPAEVLSVLHMHANRLIGTDRALEDRSYAVLRAAAQSYVARRRPHSG
ncbi:lantibiotic dehydratase [Streptomyces sp. H39-S7]|uniref:lantibiotic dehydratase n=1 Tax=Streptomyces sp. H39-S7 TaxID=3004357 RepID=UPI0022B07A7F|nr:lantibiotic dehydratase [Streptomyces sp. H39-S7]MCZ4120030.1 lantibiotic dehydratase [Streptomyces sp. H39-S7]